MRVCVCDLHFSAIVLLAACAVQTRTVRSSWQGDSGFALNLGLETKEMSDKLALACNRSHAGHPSMHGFTPRLANSIQQHQSIEIRVSVARCPKRTLQNRGPRAAAAASPLTLDRVHTSSAVSVNSLGVGFGTGSVRKQVTQLVIECQQDILILAPF